MRRRLGAVPQGHDQPDHHMGPRLAGPGRDHQRRLFLIGPSRSRTTTPDGRRTIKFGGRGFLSIRASTSTFVGGARPRRPGPGGEPLADVGRRPALLRRSVGQQGGPLGRGRPPRRLRGDDLVRQESGVDRLQGLAELARVVPAITANSRGGRQQEVQRDQALTGGRGAFSKTSWTRRVARPASAGRRGRSSAEPGKGGRGHRVARGGGVVVGVLLAGDQGLVALARVEEAAVVGVGNSAIITSARSTAASIHRGSPVAS